MKAYESIKTYLAHSNYMHDDHKKFNSFLIGAGYGFIHKKTFDKPYCEVFL